MVSVCAYSGAYPTGYGQYQLSTEGIPSPLYDAQIASGFTHFQQSGAGAIRKYYNYFGLKLVSCRPALRVKTLS
jgi:hypothetical protein